VTLFLGLEDCHSSKMPMIVKSVIYLLVIALVMIGFASIGNMTQKSTLLKYQGAKDINNVLSFEIHTEFYGSLSPSVLAAYGFSAIIEPHRNLVLKPVNGRSGSTYTWTLTEIANDAVDGVATDKVLIDRKVADELPFMVTSKAPQKFRLEMIETDSEGIVTTVIDETIASMYVRREFRNLVDSERIAYSNALSEIYHLSYEDGVEKYGDDYKRYEYFTSKHNSKSWCYHGGLQFLTTHAGFTLDLDK
jgi:hypothetical protein